MDTVQSLRARATAHVTYSIERLFVAAVLVALSLLVYQVQAGAPLLAFSGWALLPAILYALCALLFLALAVGARKRSSPAFIQGFSLVQVGLDLCMIPLFAVLSAESLLLVLLCIPIVGSANLFHSRAPLTVSFLAALSILIVSIFGGVIRSLSVLAPFVFTFELMYIPVGLGELLLVFVCISVGSIASFYGKALRDRALLIATPRTPTANTQERAALHNEETHRATERALKAKEFEVERANERLSGLEKAKADFVSVATHQLRTPLAGIKWTFEMLLSGEQNPNQRELLEKGFAATERMVRIVNEILSIDKIEHERFDVVFTYGNILKLVEGSVVEFQAPAIGKGLRLNWLRPEGVVPDIEMDADKMRMVIDNLIENAIKYTPVSGDITVSLDTSRINSAHPVVGIVVRDSGIGIDEAAQHEIFNKFYRAPNARRSEPNGTGLGLYIAKTIVEAHHGSIWFESEAGKGTEFHAEFPIHQKP